MRQPYIQSATALSDFIFFLKNVFVCYFCYFLSTTLFLHNYNVMTGSEIYDRQINNYLVTTDSRTVNTPAELKEHAARVRT